MNYLDSLHLFDVEGLFDTLETSPGVPYEPCEPPDRPGSVDEVLQSRPDLTRKQAWELLKAVGDVPDYGLSRDVVRACAIDLYGDAGIAYADVIT
jgi:hypothetical protein